MNPTDTPPRSLPRGSAAARRTVWRSLACLVLAAAALSGCASIDPLDVTLVNLRVTDVTVFETSAVFTIRIANENRSDLVVDGGVYNLYVDGKRIGKGLSDETMDLPRLGFATTDVEIHLSNLALATRLRSLLEQKTFSYRIKGKAFIKGDLRPTSVKIDRSGFFDLDQTLNEPAKLDLEKGIGD